MSPLCTYLRESLRQRRKKECTRSLKCYHGLFAFFLCRQLFIMKQENHEHRQTREHTGVNDTGSHVRPGAGQPLPLRGSWTVTPSSTTPSRKGLGREAGSQVGLAPQKGDPASWVDAKYARIPLATGLVQGWSDEPTREALALSWRT